MTLQNRLGLDGSVGGGSFDGNLHDEEAVKRFQGLIFRMGGGRWTEVFMCSVKGSQLHVAPADVDIGAGVVWLPDTAFKEEEEEEVIVGEGGGEKEEGGEMNKEAGEDEEEEEEEEEEEFSLEAAILEGEVFSEVGGGRKFGTFLPIFHHDDKDNVNSVEVDALIMHTGLMPSAVIRGEAAKFNLGIDEQQLGIFSSFIDNFGVGGNEGEDAEGKERESEKKEKILNEAVWDPKKMTIIEIWQRRQELGWEAKKLRGEGRGRIERIEAEANECLRSLEDRISKFTLR